MSFSKQKSKWSDVPDSQPQLTPDRHSFSAENVHSPQTPIDHAPSTTNEIVLDWRFEEDDNTISYLVETPPYKAIWTAEKYLECREQVVARYMKEAPFAAARKNTILPTTPDSNSLTKTLRALGSTNVEDDPQAQWSDEAREPMTRASEQAMDPVEAETDINTHRYPYKDCFEPREWRLSNICVDLITRLSAETGTNDAMWPVGYGIHRAVDSFGNAALFQQFTTESELDTTSVGLLGAVWLWSCYFVTRRRRPVVLVARSCSSLLYSLWRVEIQVRSISLARFTNIVQTWERYLDSSQALWDDFFAGDLEDDLQIPKSSHDPSTNPYMIALLSSAPYGGLAKVLLEHDPDVPTTPVDRIVRDPKSKQFLQIVTMKLLASIEPILLEACITGRMVQLADQTGHKVSEILKRNKTQTDKPVIYVNHLVDGVSMSPTPAQLKQVVKIMCRYIDVNDTEFNDEAASIDQLICPSRRWPTALTLLGYRRYCDWRTVDVKRTDEYDMNRRSVLRNFLERLQVRINAEIEAGRRYVPLARPLVEVGFTTNASSRLREHQRHRNSNYIMNLTEAVMYWLCGRRLYTLQQNIVFVCWQPCQQWLGEVYFHRLFDAYTNHGTGFSHYPAGLSNTGAYTVVPMVTWRKWNDWADKELSTAQRIAKEHQRNLEELQDYQRESRRMKKSGLSKLTQAKEAGIRTENDISQLDAWLECLNIVKG